MGRKRSPEHDYICQRCLAACDAAGTRHLSQGTLHKRPRGARTTPTTTCGRAPLAILRSTWDGMIDDDGAAVRAQLERQSRFFRDNPRIEAKE